MTKFLRNELVGRFALAIFGILAMNCSGAAQDIVPQLRSETQAKLREFESIMKDKIETMRMVNELLPIVVKDPSVLEKLAIPNYQEVELKTILKNYQNDLATLARIRIDDLQEVQRAAANNDMDTVVLRNIELDTAKLEISADAMKRIEDVILPHQVSRLKQIALQKRLTSTTRHFGLLGAPYELAQRMEIGPSDLQKLKRLTEELNDKLEEEIRALHEKYLKEIVDSLPTKTRESIMDQLGEISPLSFARSPR